MAVIQSQSRLQLEKSIGYNLGALHVGESTDTGDTTVLNDSALWGHTDEHKGKWVHVSDTDTSTPLGEIQRVESNDTATALTTSAFTTKTLNNMEYFLWDEDYPPATIHNFINRAIHSITRKGAPPTTDLTLHTGGYMRSFAIPTTVKGIQRVQIRRSHTGTNLLTCDSAMDELTSPSGVTLTADTKDYMEGSGSNKFVLATVGATTLLGTQDITAKDISGYTHCEFWMKSTVALTADQMQIHLAPDAECATPDESLAVPVTTANTWTYHRVALANPGSDTAIVSVGLYQKADVADCTVRVDDIGVTRDKSETWEPIHRSHWYIERSGSKLYLDETAYAQAGYALLRLIGFKKPTELNANATSCDIEPEYIISKATALALRARADRRADRREAAHLEADRWEALAERALARQQVPSNVRWAD